MSSGEQSRSAREGPVLSTEEQLALAVEALSEHLVLFDAEDRIVLANKAWRALNTEIEEFTRPGVRFEDHLRAAVAHGLIPESKGREETWLRERLEYHRNPRGAIEIARQDGRWVRVHEQLLPNGGRILIVSDITESKQADKALREGEERFRAVVNNSPTKIHIKDADGRYVLVNDLAAELFGFTEAEARGKTSYDLFPEETADAFTAHDQQVLKAGQAFEQEEVWECEEGTRTFLTVKFPIYNAADQVTGVGAIGTDITDRKDAEARLRQSEELLQQRVAELEEAQRRLEQQGEDLKRLAADLRAARDQSDSASRAKSEFLATMSHELRTPLNAIIGFSEIMMAERLGPMGTPSYRDYAQDIAESGRHLLDLINDILDLSKVESGREELHENNIEIAEAVSAVMRLVRPRALAGKVALDLELPGALPWLYADLRKLKQILVNLLTNAVKFTKPGGRVVLRCRCEADGGHVFEVEDTGVGIAARDIGKAFSQFGQIDSAFARTHEGSGLGLPLTKLLVELHGGSLELQSEPGVGTTVTVRFPPERSVTVQRAFASGA